MVFVFSSLQIFKIFAASTNFCHFRLNASNPRYKVIKNKALLILNIMPSDIGTYRCHVQTLVDETVIEATIYYSDQGRD
jgi:hypothetical protein